MTSGTAKRILTTGVALLVCVQMSTLTGCGKKEPPPPPPPKRAPPPPPPPERIELAPLMRGIDARVQFPAGKAPYDESLAGAVISFAAAFASGDDAALGGMLDLSSRGILDSMLADGTWFDSTDEIEAVRVVCMTQQPDGADEASYSEFVLAVQEPGGAFTLGWAASATDGGWVMSPISTVDLTLPRAADWDSDSIGAYGSDQGWSGTGAPQSFANPSFDEPDIGMILYLMQEMTPVLAGTGGANSGAMNDAFMQGLVGSGQVSEDDAKQMIKEGEASVRSGGKPSSADVAMIVQSLTMAGPMAGMDWDEDTILDAMAGVLKISKAEMREIYDG